MEDMLRGITAGSAAASHPLLRALVGAGASESEYAALAQEAEALWKRLDTMAEEKPEEYDEFIKGTAKEAQKVVEAARDPHVEGLDPALVLEAQATAAAGSTPPAGAGAAKAAGKESDVAPGLSSVANLVSGGGGRAVARVHIWAANEGSGVPPARCAAGAPVCARTADWAGVTVPLAEYRPVRVLAGPLPVYQIHLACHQGAVSLAAGGEPPAFLAVLLEAASQFVEQAYALQLSRSVRTVQVHRGVVSEARLRALQQQAQQHVRMREEGTEAGATGDASVPKGLLGELLVVGKPADGKGKPATGVKRETQPKSKKPLIEEL